MSKRRPQPMTDEARSLAASAIGLAKGMGLDYERRCPIAWGGDAPSVALVALCYAASKWSGEPRPDGGPPMNFRAFARMVIGQRLVMEGRRRVRDQGRERAEATLYRAARRDGRIWKRDGDEGDEDEVPRKLEERISCRSPSPLDSMIWAETLDVACAQLRPHEAKLVRARFGDGLAPADIAERYGMTHRSVVVILNNALRRLRRSEAMKRYATAAA